MQNKYLYNRNGLVMVEEEIPNRPDLTRIELHFTKCECSMEEPERYYAGTFAEFAIYLAFRGERVPFHVLHSTDRGTKITLPGKPRIPVWNLTDAARRILWNHNFLVEAYTEIYEEKERYRGREFFERSEDEIDFEFDYPSRFPKDVSLYAELKDRLYRQELQNGCNVSVGFSVDEGFYEGRGLHWYDFRDWDGSEVISITEETDSPNWRDDKNIYVSLSDSCNLSVPLLASMLHRFRCDSKVMAPPASAEENAALLKKAGWTRNPKDGFWTAEWNGNPVVEISVDDDRSNVTQPGREIPLIELQAFLQLFILDQLAALNSAQPG